MKHDALTPAQRSLRARAAAFALHAQGGTTTRAATAAFLSRFERQVDPDGILAPEERSRRAGLARKAYMSSLALKSSRTRSRSAAARRVSGAIDRATAGLEAATDSESAATARMTLAALEGRAMGEDPDD